MAVIAVAGGTGGVGRTIVNVLLQESKHQVIVLTRKATTSPIPERLQQVEVDYRDVSALVRTLEQYEIDTVVSAISLYSDETSESQLNLIKAAEKSIPTRRFIPSEYSYIQTEDLLPIDPGVKYFIDAAKLLQNGNLKYTRVIPGFFMDYWGMPHVRTNLQPFTFGIDIASGHAAIPGDGNDVIGMTYTYDMAAFIARLLHVEEWPEFSVIVGDDITYNQLIELGEQVRGKKFRVVHDSPEQIKEGNVTVPPMPEGLEYTQEELRETTALVSRLTIAQVFDFPAGIRSNSKFPDLKLVQVKEFIDNAWKGKP
ncbi:hypothetical protein P175DRAFT_0428272 [Aspergillus ochraceoroseus IBT 24754]|uniref:NmrA-like domain-containing protein n=3 Tax=Aspergillus subgen. Nidulantes TaxID=2720870 RepID=A0A0F8WWR0_9EURO|nr:uncharacterized protein P175DRAFT_0428272 [Aspergillus ochraceoroseus IBT 24754]KKK15762.1 hypothetical protein ARAM_004287 [Aspergillus rambellii]KKK21056.1 hypothetical protein AOCH_004849 [Aspergillus ochraceoroseus]PTU24592.1 hypothetical protein P175DRAFT_0428272 [Aspergillus ochraceoroseus IBT 24754]